MRLPGFEQRWEAGTRVRVWWRGKWRVGFVVKHHAVNVDVRLVVNEESGKRGIIRRRPDLLVYDEETQMSGGFRSWAGERALAEGEATS